MGRIEPTPSGSASAGAVAQAWAEHETGRQARSAKLMADAEAWVSTQPELLVDGLPCHVAIEAALSIRTEQPAIKGSAFLAAVAAARERHLRRLAESGWFTSEEIDRVLTGEGWPDA